MPLGAWASNVPPEDTGFEHADICNYLGVNWDTGRDTLSIKWPSALDDPLPPKLTKRKLVSLFATPFDPLGFIAPITLQGKLLIQALWADGYKWDQPLPTEYRERAQTALKAYKGLDGLQVPRKAISPEGNLLHIFADASTKAYGTCAYVTGEGTPTLLTARSRVAPLGTKKLTVPRLELLALLIACRLAQSLQEVYPNKFNSIHVWTDAMVALQWVWNNKGQTVYVLNRVEEIQKLVKQCNIQLMYVPTKDNPADLASRGTSAKHLASSPFWFCGPAWLYSPDEYPQQPSPSVHSLLIGASVSSLTIAAVPSPPLTLRLEEFTSLKNACGAIRRLANYARRHSNKPLREPLAVLLRLTQQQELPETLNYLMGKPHHLENSDKKIIRQFQLQLDENRIIRCGTRLQAADLGTSAAHPIFLPRKAPLWKLIVKARHEENLHVNAGTLTVLLKQDYWVPRMKQSIKFLLNQCLRCKMVQNQPLPPPPAAPLPPERLQLVIPFQHVGIDYTGAIEVHRSHVPHIYILLVTCTTTRAVALYVTESMTAIEFLHTFRRHCARYGTPLTIFSDNAATFKQCGQFMTLLHQAEEIQGFLRQKAIQWKYITPRAPWTGGFYERMVGTVKRCLKKATFRHKPTLTEYGTLIAEAETVVNNRPLTSQGDDEPSIPLTPSHLVHGRIINLAPIVTLHHNDDPDYAPDQKELRVHYQKLTNFIFQYKRAWQKEYITTLRDRQLALKHRNPPSIKPGDLVLVLTDNRPRDEWPLGVITDVFPGPDQVIRSVQVRTAHSTYCRPTRYIVPLECHRSEEEQSHTPPATIEEPPALEGHAPFETSNHVDTTIPPTVKVHTSSTNPKKTGRSKKLNTPPTRRRPQRHAAQAARAKLKELLTAEEED